VGGANWPLKNCTPPQVRIQQGQPSAPFLTLVDSTYVVFALVSIVY
jgi:hypothetical protein